MKNISAILIMLFLLFVVLKLIAPHIDYVISRQRATTKTRKDQALKFLESLTVPQIMSINNYYQNGATTFGMVTMLGDENFFIINQSSGIAETLRHCPELFEQAATRKLTPI